MRRLTAVIRGIQSCATCLACCPSRSRRWHDSRFVSGTGVPPVRRKSETHMRDARATIAMIRVVLPFHLRTLARAEGEVQLEVAAPVTIRSTLEALEEKFPVLCGTIRDHGTF